MTVTTLHSYVYADGTSNKKITTKKFSVVLSNEALTFTAAQLGFKELISVSNAHGSDGVARLGVWSSSTFQVQFHALASFTDVEVAFTGTLYFSASGNGAT